VIIHVQKFQDQIPAKIPTKGPTENLQSIRSITSRCGGGIFKPSKVHTVHGRRILLAEDQLGVREAIKLLLHVDQHVVTEAKNGREAFDLLAHNRFDLVITDFGLAALSANRAIGRREILEGTCRNNRESDAA